MSELKSKNTGKFEAYKLAFGQIDSSIAARFPLHAIAIAESIIADRFLSYLMSTDNTVSCRTAFGTLISKIKQKCKNEDDYGENLAEHIDIWRKERNSFLHGIVKSEPQTAPEIVAHRFIEEAIKSAKKGKKLARDVCTWHTKRKREYDKKQCKGSTDCSPPNIKSIEG